MTTPSVLIESIDVPSLMRKLLPGWTPSAPQVTLSDVQYALKAPEGKQDVVLGIAALGSPEAGQPVCGRRSSHPTRGASCHAPGRVGGSSGFVFAWEKR
jgi:hypothetical protein